MAEHRVIEITTTDDAQLARQVREAEQLAADEHRMTFFVRDGHRTGAVVPVGVAVAMEPGSVTLGSPLDTDPPRRLAADERERAKQAGLVK